MPDVSESDMDGDSNLDDGDPEFTEEPADEQGHPLTARDAFPFLPKVIG